MERQCEVLDFSIVARWEEGLPAEVFLYTKVKPKARGKVELLHLQELVVGKTLVRAVPLLPDGTSPRTSPGIAALGIPVVAGRGGGGLVARRCSEPRVLDGGGDLRAFESSLGRGRGADARGGALDGGGRAASMHSCADATTSGLGCGEHLDIPTEGGFSRGSFGEEFLGIRMATEGDMLTVVFPERIREDAVVIEIMLRVNPAYLDGKPYPTFAFTGLPCCSRGAFIDFKIAGEADWEIHPFPRLTPRKPDAPVHNRLRGTLDTSQFSKICEARSRALLIRAVECLAVMDVADFVLETETTASFLWCHSGECIIAEFDIKLSFSNIALGEAPKRCKVSVYMLDGPDAREDLLIESSSGDPVEFVMADHESENPATGSRAARLLQIERLPGDVANSLRINFCKKHGKAPQKVRIPSIRAGGDPKLCRERVAIKNPRLPLHITCSPDTLRWEEEEGAAALGDESASAGVRKFIRVGAAAGADAPSVLITSLTPLKSPAADEMERALRDPDSFIDRICYDIEDNARGQQDGTPAVSVGMKLFLPVRAPLEPMQEIARIRSGGFRVTFVTVDGLFVRKGALFEDRDEAILLNYGIAGGGDKRGELVVHIEWFSEQRLALSCGEVEYRLPQMTGKIIGRAVFKCPNQEARIISRAQTSDMLDSSYGFSRGKVTLTGLDNSTCELLFQAPREASGRGQLAPLVGLRTASAASGDGGEVSPASHPPSPAVSSSSSGCGATYHSFSDPDSALSSLAGATMSRHPHSPGRQPADGDAVYISTPANQIDRKLSSVLAILFLIALAANFIGQSARINELATSLRRTRTLLEELESANPHLTIRARPHESREEAMRLSVAGGLGSQDLAAVGVLGVEDAGRDVHGQEPAVADAETVQDGGSCGSASGNERGQRSPPPGKVPAWGGYGCRNGEGIGEKHNARVARVLRESTLSEALQRAVAGALEFIWMAFFGEV